MKPTSILFTTFILIFCRCSFKKNDNAAIYDRKAYDYYNERKLDSAFYMYTQYVNSTNNILRKGVVYRYMGDMQWEAGDLHGAEESATGAIKTLDSLNKAHHAELSYVYHLLGNVHLDLRHYDEAVRMYNKAANFSSDPDFILELMNGKAVALQKKGRYNDAVNVYDSMLLLKPADQSLVARIIDNRAKTKWLQNPGYPALPEYWYAKKIRTDSQYIRGLNASYAHLSDYYTKLNPDSALWYANKTYLQAQLIQSADDRLDAIDKLIRLDNAANSKHWYDEFKRLNDSIRLSRDTAINRFALIRYDSQKSKADNLELKEQRLWLFGLIALAFVFIAWLRSRYNKRRKRIEHEAAISIKDNKLKISQKVHDVVANGLYNIMNEVEHSKELERESLLNKVEVLYEKSRNISYDDASFVDNAEYDKQIFLLLRSFENDQTDVILNTERQTFLDNLSSFQKQQLQLILNEIMINMKKHSKAKKVEIAFRQEDEKAVIVYNDDGIGFSDAHKNGNGLNNTVSRIESLKGEINFGKSNRGGALISMSFPLASSNT